MINWLIYFEWKLYGNNKYRRLYTFTISNNNLIDPFSVIIFISYCLCTHRNDTTKKNYDFKSSKLIKIDRKIFNTNYDTLLEQVYNL